MAKEWRYSIHLYRRSPTTREWNLYCTRYAPSKYAAKIEAEELEEIARGFRHRTQFYTEIEKRTR